MPQSAEDTKKQLENTTENPVRDALRQVIQVTLVFDGVDFEPDELYDALDDKYGTVSNEKDVAAHDCYIFRISE